MAEAILMVFRFNFFDNCSFLNFALIVASKEHLFYYVIQFRYFPYDKRKTLKPAVPLSIQEFLAGELKHPSLETDV